MGETTDGPTLGVITHRQLSAACAVLALALTGVGALAGRAPAAATLTWGTCQNQQLAEAGARCATVTVPLDHANPAGRTIPIAISRIPAKAPGKDYLGPLLANPGGPGVSGLTESADLAAVLSPAVAGRFDLIGFDPRGVGESGPELRCDPAYYTRPTLDYVPLDPARITDAELRRREAVTTHVRACADNNGDYLAHLRTVDAARDLDLVRAALGSATLSYIGNSYGTYLGQVYSSLFPTRVSRMVLTGVVAPTGVGYAGDLSRPVVARAFERNLDAFFAWVADYHGVYGLGGDTAAVRGRFYGDLNNLRTAPRNGIGPAEWTQLFATVVYGDEYWAALAQGWSGWAAGRTAVFDRFFGGYDPVEVDASHAAYQSVACSDGRWPRRYDRIRADSLRTARQARYITWYLHWEVSVLCSLWPAQHRPVPVGSAATSMLLVNGTFDAPTPIADAVATRAVFPRAALIEVSDSLGHGSRSLWGNPCAQAAVERYLMSGELPARTDGAGPDVRCDRLPPPGYPEIALAAVGEAAIPLLPLLP